MVVLTQRPLHEFARFERGSVVSKVYLGVINWSEFEGTHYGE
jgi:hypothetical protein